MLVARVVGDATGCCARARSGSTAARPRCMRAQRHADYSYRLAVDPPAAKEVRLFGLADWVIDRFTAQRRRLYDLQYEATRLRERSVAAAPRDRAGRQPACVFWTLGRPSRRRRPRPGGRRSSPCRPRSASARSPSAGSTGRSTAPPRRSPRSARWRARWPPAGALPTDGHGAVVPAGRGPGDPLPRRVVRLPRRPARPRRLRPDDPGRLVAGDRRPERRRQDDAGQAAVPPLRPGRRGGRGRRHRPAGARPRRLAAPRHRRVPGLRALRAAAARQRRPPAAACRRRRRSPRSHGAGAGDARRRSTPRWPRATRAAPTSPAGSGSGSRWPAPSCAVRSGAGVVLLDEPTAQLDVRGEAEIFERILAATARQHDDPRLAPLLHRAPGRPHLRARARGRSSSSARTTS